MVQSSKQDETTEIRIRLWPAVLIAVVQLGVIFGATRFASTNVQHVICFGIVPLGAGLLLAPWWLMASRAPWRARIFGLVLAAAILVWPVLLQESNGYLILMIAVPALSVGVVAVLLVTYRMRWPARRWVIVGAMIVLAAVFSAIRINGITGRMQPDWSWRWESRAVTSEAPMPDLVVAEPGAVAELPAQPGPQDWPGFRGPARDNRVPGTTFSTDWSENVPLEVWRRRIGLGWSSFAVVGDYLFTQEQRGEEELVVCYRADTGEPIWVNRVAARFDSSMGVGPRATPTYHQGRLYTLGATGVVQCIDPATGKTTWQRDLTEDTGADVPPPWGFASSPLVAGNHAIVFAGGKEGKAVVAYDLASGDVAWVGGEKGHGYSSAHLARISDIDQVLMVSDSGVQSFVPGSGEVLWGHAWAAKQYPRVVQPVLPDANSVMIGSTTGTGTRLLRVQKEGTAWKVEEQWTNKAFRPYFNDCVCHKGYCYGFDGNRLVCVDLATGKKLWKGESCGGQVLLFPDMNTLLVLSESGEVVLVEATPEKYREVARFRAIEGKTWNHPVVAYGKLFVRNAEEAACFELALQ
jgi:outer membrane protein assembly factor BamB